MRYLLLFLFQGSAQPVLLFFLASLQISIYSEIIYIRRISVFY